MCRPLNVFFFGCVHYLMRVFYQCTKSLKNGAEISKWLLSTRVIFIRIKQFHSAKMHNSTAAVRLGWIGVRSMSQLKIACVRLHLSEKNCAYQPHKPESNTVHAFGWIQEILSRPWFNRVVYDGAVSLNSSTKYDADYIAYGTVLWLGYTL